MPQTEEAVRRFFDRHAGRYDRGMRLVERCLLGDHRWWAVAQARGRVLEIGVGTGLNLPLYPETVTDVLGIDLSAGMLHEAQARIARHRLTGREVRQADAQRLDLATGSFDTVLSTYTVCTVPEPHQAFTEAFRVLRPGGRLVLVEHGPATNTVIQFGQRMLNPLTVRFQGDHLLRDPLPWLRAAGFAVLWADRAGRAGLVHRVVAARPGRR